jgi:hypothetical protein
MRPCRMHFDGDWQTLQGVNMAIHSLFVAIGLAIFMNKQPHARSGRAERTRGLAMIVYFTFLTGVNSRSWKS